MPLFTQYNSQVVFLDEIKKELEKKEQEHGVLRDYYEGRQWSVKGVRTRSGSRAIDVVKRDKVYFGVVVNLIKDCVDTIKNLASGTDGVSSNIADVLSVNFECLHDEIVENMLVHGDAYLKLEKGYDGNVKLRVLDNQTVFHRSIDVDDGSDSIRKYEEFAIVHKEGNTITATIYAIDFIRIYENGMLVSEVPNILGFVPIFEIEGFESYVEDLIQTQDMINISLTQEFEINKYAGDPLTVVNGMMGAVDMNQQEITKNRISLGAGEVMLTGKDMNVERIAGQGMSQQALDAIDRYKKDLYRIGKVGALKNDDLSGVSSGYAISMKLLETTSFIKKIRNTIKSGFAPIFKVISESFGIEAALNYSDIFPISTIDKIEEAKGYRELGLSQKFILVNLGLSAEQIDDELNPSTAS